MPPKRTKKDIDLDYFLKKCFVNSPKELDKCINRLLERSSRLTDIELILDKKWK